MSKISVCIITFNEEKDIKRCLDSVLKITDDIIVVDSFSTDQTENICKSFPQVTFVQRKWTGYSDQKNYAHSLAKHDWIFSIDADEVIGDELERSILKAKEIGLNGVYQCNRITNYCGKWIKNGGWYPDWKLRLFNKNEAKWDGLIHEEVKHSFSEVKKLSGDLLHYSYHSIHQHVAQFNKFTELTAQKDKERGKKASLIRILTAPLVKFIKDYFIKRGFLDGYYGFVVASLSAFATLLKYIKLKELWKKG